MSYGLPYDSDEGRALAGAITAIMTGHAYEQSAEIAERAWARSRAIAMPVARTCPSRSRRTTSNPCSASLNSIATRSKQSSRAQEFNYLKEEARALLGSARSNAASKHGYRNAQVTVLAPTGTIAFLMDCDTTGVEPDIALVKYKLLAGGGMLKIVNRTVPEALAAPRLRRGASREHHRAHREIRHDRRCRRKRRRPIQSGLKPEHLAGVRLRVQGRTAANAASSYMAHLEDDGRGAAVHQRRDFQNRQHAATNAPSKTFAMPTCRPGRWA